MGWTKQEFIDQAFTENGLAPQVFNVDPDKMVAALRNLDSMMATWYGRGIRLGYPLPSSPGDSNPDDDTGVPDSANEAIYLNLAIRLAPSCGKTVSIETKASAQAAYQVILSAAARPGRQSSRVLPAGAGNKWTRRPFLSPDPVPLEAADGGDVLDFT